MGLGTMLSGNVKCDWCGRTYKSCHDNSGIDAIAIGAIAGVVHGLKKNYCSKACKIAAKNAKGGGNKSSISSGAKNSDDNYNVEMEKIKAEEKKAKVNALEDITNLNISGTSEEIQAVLNNLASKASGIKGIFKSSHDKKILRIIKEKLEFGIMKLNSMGNKAEADYFQNKLNNIK